MVTFTYGGHGIFPSGIMLELKVIRLLKLRPGHFGAAGSGRQQAAGFGVASLLSSISGAVEQLISRAPGHCVL